MAQITQKLIKNGCKMRISIEVNAQQHRAIKVAAAFSGMTIKEFLLSGVAASTAKAEQILRTAPKPTQIREKNRRT